ncbi:MAG: hypothetical protein ACTHOK_06110 [Nocardioidaceae bacterium]
MRPLLLLTSAAGLLLGTVAAAAWRYQHLRQGGWVAYGRGGDVHVTWQSTGWLPAIVVGPVAGVLLGVATGWLLGRAGWRLVRKP